MTSMPDTRYSAPDKYDNRQRLIPPEYRITGAMGKSLLRAYQARDKSVWTNRTCMERLCDIELAEFTEHRVENHRLQYKIKLTKAGVAKARSLG